MNLRDLPDMSAAYQQVQEKKCGDDGNLANNYPPYDKVTRGDVIAGATGKDAMGGKKKHDCAKKVKCEGKEFDVIPEQHTMLEDGTVTHYDITDGEYIYENVPVEDLEILISEKHEHFDNYDKNAEVLGENQEFDLVGWAEDAILELSEEEEIDNLTDDELVGIFETALLELAEGPEDLEEMADILESLESEMEYIFEEVDTETKRQIGGIKRKIAHSKKMDRMVSRSSQLASLKAKKANNSERDAGAEARKKLASKPEAQTRGERLKAAAKEAGSRAKSGLKSAASTAKKVAVKTAGAAGEVAGAMRGGYEKGRREAGGSSSSSSSSSSSGGSSSSSGGESRRGTDTSRGATRRAAGGALKAIGRLAKTVVKKGVGKTARAVSRGSNALAKRLGEDYEHIDHLVESGLFEMVEIEAIILEDAKYDRNRKRAAERAAARNAARAAGKTGVVPGVGYVSPRPERETYVDSAGVTRHKSGAKMPKKEEVEQYVDFLVDEGYDCSELTWEEITEEYESLDEGLRSAVKRLLGKKDKPAEKKPESRGEQLRKKYNVGPEKSDTSAKRQILNRTRAKAERDKEEFGGSRYSKSVADKSAAAHDRYLKAGYSKYGADRKTGSGNKARKRAAALKKEEVVMEGLVSRALDKAKEAYKKDRKFGKASGEAIDRLQRMNQYKQDKYGPSTFKQRMKTGAEHNTDNEKKAKGGK